MAQGSSDTIRQRMLTRILNRPRMIGLALRLARNGVDDVLALTYVVRLEAVLADEAAVSPGQIRLIVREYARRARIEFDDMDRGWIPNTLMRTELKAWRECLGELENTAGVDDSAFVLACDAYLLASRHVRETNDTLRLAAFHQRFPDQSDST